jgi:YD repeat-containing protein
VQNPNARRTTLQYDAASQLTTLSLGLGDVRQLQYDAASRLTTQVDANGSTRTTQVDTYDGVSNRTKRVADGVITTWTYDATYQLLTQQRVGANTTLSYDPVGNISLKWEDGSFPMTFTYNTRNQPTTMIQGGVITSYTHNFVGAMTLENVGGARTTYSYSQRNLLNGAVNSDGTRSTYTYRYDKKRRTAQEPGGSVSTMIWDGEDYLGEV